MNYIELNGVRNTLIQGLMIQELPPISKPLMRTSIEEIEGRDGDIVTKLGYSAYDKELTIGVFGNYDINEIIKYFDSEGTVIFSNEPDKFYRYQILEQIDFERLGRFRSATVTFHVQPFKFSAVDDAFWITTDVLKLKSFRSESNAPKVISNGEYISITGSVADNSFAIPIDAVTLNGSYTLDLKFDGKGGEDPSFLTEYDVRLYDTTPTDADSFGGTAYTLNYTDSAITDTQTLSNKSFHYVGLDTHDDSDHADISLHLWANSSEYESVELVNRGNVYARPKLTIYGSGDIDLYINGEKIFDIALGSDGFIVLDGETMNAYKGDVLKNRSVSGDFEDLVFKVGNNTLGWVGTVREIKVENGSRWL